MSSTSTSPLASSSPSIKKSKSCMDLSVINISHSQSQSQLLPVVPTMMDIEIMGDSSDHHAAMMEDLKLGETLLLNLMHSRDKIPILSSSGSSFKLSSSSSSIPIRREGSHSHLPHNNGNGHSSSSSSSSSHHHHPYGVSKSLPSTSMIDLGLDNNNSLAKLKNRLNSSTNSMQSSTTTSMQSTANCSPPNGRSRSSSPISTPPSSSAHSSFSPIASSSSSFINNILLIDEEDSITTSPESDYECSRLSPPVQCIEELSFPPTAATTGSSSKTSCSVHDLLVPTSSPSSTSMPPLKYHHTTSKSNHQFIHNNINNNSPAKNRKTYLTNPTSLSTTGQCTFDDPCLLCRRGTPILLTKTATWASIMKVVFFTLADSLPHKTYYSLKSDVYGFMDHHWDILSLNKKKSTNWHKQIQDMLSHSKIIFESGVELLGQNGFWRLKHLSDPWLEGVISGYGNQTSSPSSSTIQPPSPPTQYQNLRISSSKVPLSMIRPILPAN
ncbi:hypothetical protein DFA_01629 [Cavenderia fasciculata]|uniref:Uncharacterized protein n=1 Tax=Cavenderia fasciculata TaxID=261658 RepID=F4PTX5_CACFS|nr:uncharacterized protein DFA_01629 [Cavenderia fasciculata]EGG21743.1 hypothetical protein DFA_01629 [Cavenderia fasciculata]|eukprot:XP_004359593.1 hypothetical protein DFA_01629 [Cavenderia fasciculata]